MSQRGKIMRYARIIEKLNSKRYPSLLDLNSFLDDHGLEVSERTLQRDIENIRTDFGIDIQYDKSRNGYHVNAENSINLKNFYQFLEIVGTSELLQDSLRENKETLNYVHFESQGEMKGIENLKPLLAAIKNCNRISFVHENFHSGYKRKFSINPYLLKEYQNRWYVVGKYANSKEFRTFGVDRMTELKISDKTFKPDKNADPASLFDNIIGLVYSLGPVEEVVLSFTPEQGQYIKALPMHSSQEIIRDDEEALEISLYVSPNYELSQKILMHGDTVKVLKPKSLANQIKKILKSALKNYA